MALPRQQTRTVAGVTYTLTRFIRQHHRIKHSGIVGVLQKVTDADAVQT